MIMKRYILVILVLLLIGCTPNPIIIERNITVNRTVYVNQTIYVNNTIYINDTVPCNITEPEIDTTIYDRSYVLSLIRQLKYYEKQQDKYLINNSDCDWELNQSNIKREKAEIELCQWNISWC